MQPGHVRDAVCRSTVLLLKASRAIRPSNCLFAWATLRRVSSEMWLHFGTYVSTSDASDALDSNDLPNIYRHTCGITRCCAKWSQPMALPRHNVHGNVRTTVGVVNGGREPNSTSWFTPVLTALMVSSTSGLMRPYLAVSSLPTMYLLYNHASVCP